MLTEKPWRPTTRAELLEHLDWLETRWLPALLERRSAQHGFTYTREHLAIEDSLDRLEARKRGRPALTLLEGGRTK